MFLTSVGHSHRLDWHVWSDCLSTLIYSKSPEEHAQHVEAVLSALERHHLYAKASKCQFGMAELDFLGHTISGAGIKVDARKVKAIHDWPDPSDAHQLRCFLGLAGFYRRFVNRFSHIAAPLTNITGAKATWRWSEVSKMIHCSPTRKTVTGPGLADLVINNVFRYHGLPRIIISDRDPRTTSNFWRALFNIHGNQPEGVHRLPPSD
eukprot:jgi/Astpho2/5507/Aster-x0685